MWFYFLPVVLSSSIMTATRNSPGYPVKRFVDLLSYCKYYDNLTKIYFFFRWLVGADLSKRDTCFPTKVEAGFGILK